MTGLKLMALRHLLFMSVNDASRFVGEVAERTWRFWESQSSEVPDDVAAKMDALLLYRNEIYQSSINLITEMPNNCPKIFPYYATLEDWMGIPMTVPMKWRAHCSAMAALVVDHGIELVRFNNDYYRFWLNSREDTHHLRMQWAIEALANERAEASSKALKAG